METTILHSDLSVEWMSHKRSKNAFVTTTNGSLSFGAFPKNSAHWPELEIRLKVGFAGFGRTRSGAFGVRHIYEKHSQEIGITCPSQISGYIESIITDGATVIVDTVKDENAALVIESKTGLVILRLSKDKTYYDIISAYDRKSHPGTVIAMI